VSTAEFGHVAGANRGDGHLADIQGTVAEIVAKLLHIVLERAAGERVARLHRRQWLTT